MGRPVARLGLVMALAWRNLWRNPRRTGLVLVAVGLGVWSMLSFTALLRAWSASSLDAALLDLTGQGQIHAQGYLDDPGVAHRLAPPAGPLRALLEGPEVRRWAPRVRVPAALQSAYETLPVSLVGIDPARERGLSFIATAVQQGRGLAGPEDAGILLGRRLAHRLRTGIGKRVVLMSQDAGGGLVERGFRVVGLFSAAPQLEGRYVFVGIAQAQTMLGLGRDVSEITFALRHLSGLDGFLSRLRRAAPQADCQSWESLRPMTRAMTQLSDGFVQIWLVIIFVLMAFGIVNTLLMSLHERVRELALLQALGLGPGLIFAQVTLEAALVVGLGIGAGALLGILTVLAFHHGLDLGFLARGAEWLGAGRVLYPRLGAGQVMGVALLVWTLGVGAGLLPIWHMVRRTPIDAVNRSPT
jgi:ABC-type lipoprotein release transport system permease subunit